LPRVSLHVISGSQVQRHFRSSPKVELCNSKLLWSSCVSLNFQRRSQEGKTWMVREIVGAARSGRAMDWILLETRTYHQPPPTTTDGNTDRLCGGAGLALPPQYLFPRLILLISPLTLSSPAQSLELSTPSSKARCGGGGSLANEAGRTYTRPPPAWSVYRRRACRLGLPPPSSARGRMPPVYL